MRFHPFELRDEAANEGYIFIDKYLRNLPKKSDGTIDLHASGFQDNEVDAMRHAYVSSQRGKCYEYGFVEQRRRQKVWKENQKSVTSL